MVENPTSFWQVLEQRSSIRKYSDQPVPEDMINELLRAAKLAPVAGGNRNIVCQCIADAEHIQSIAEGVQQVCTEKIEAIEHEDVRTSTLGYSKSFSWFGKAPLLLAISSRKTPLHIKQLLHDEADDIFGAKASAAMAAQNVLLAATALGLGACCLTGPLFAREWLEKSLKCPGQNNLFCLIPVGFPK